MSSADKYARLGNDYHWKWAAGASNPYRVFAERVMAQFPSDGNGLSICDFGCGDGWPASRLIARGYRVHGVEILDAPRSVAVERVPKATFSASSPDGMFDFILCSEVLEHMDDPQPLVYLISQQCQQYAILTTPPPKDNDPDAEVQYGPDDVAALFSMCEVEVIYLAAYRQIFKLTPNTQAKAKPPKPAKISSRRKTKAKADETQAEDSAD